jgi:hypothetical protein
MAILFRRLAMFLVPVLWRRGPPRRRATSSGAPATATETPRHAAT